MLAIHKSCCEELLAARIGVGLRTMSPLPVIVPFPHKVPVHPNTRTPGFPPFFEFLMYELIFNVLTMRE